MFGRLGQLFFSVSFSSFTCSMFHCLCFRSLFAFQARKTHENLNLTDQRAMSWSKGYSWSWPEPLASKGKGKKGSKKGKQQPAEDLAEEWQWQQTDSTERTGRIKSQYQLAHRSLKASADWEGSALVKHKKVDDFAFLSHKNLRHLLSADNCHLLRRPGVGLSEAASSLQSGIGVLGALDQVGLEELHLLLAQPELQEALAVLNTTDTSVEDRSSERVVGALKNLRKCSTKAEELEGLAIKATIAASRLFLLGAHPLPLRACLDGLEWWADKVPETLSEHPRFRAWKNSPKSSSKMAEAMAALLQEKLEAAAEYGKNDAATVFGRKTKPKTQQDSESDRSGKSRKKKADGKRRKKTSSGSSSSEKKKSKKGKDSKDKTKKKDKKEKTSSETSGSEKKKGKKDKDSKDKSKKKKEKERDDKKKKRSRSPSKASSSKSGKSTPKATTKEAKIRCINAVDAEGNGIVKDTDHVDTVEVASQEENLWSIKERFLKAQGKGEDAKNRQAKVLTEGVLRSVCELSTFAHACEEVALVRKGG